MGRQPHPLPHQSLQSLRVRVVYTAMGTRAVRLELRAVGPVPDHRLKAAHGSVLSEAVLTLMYMHTAGREAVARVL
jgi:hypothetical protein